MSIDSFCISKEPTPVKFESLLTYDLDRLFGDFLRDPNVSEISVNRPNEIFVGEKGKHGMTRYERPLSYEDLLTMAETAGKRTSQKITPEIRQKITEDIIRKSNKIIKKENIIFME